MISKKIIDGTLHNSIRDEFIYDSTGDGDHKEDVFPLETGA